MFNIYNKFYNLFWLQIFSLFFINNLIAHNVILVTGGAGFIGSNFVEYIYDKYSNYEIIVLDALTYAGRVDNIRKDIRESDRFKFVHGSVTDFNLVEECMQLANMVVHFAAETHVTRSIAEAGVFFETDVMGTLTLMKSLIKNKNVSKFIHISTSEVYGSAREIPMNEDHQLDPMSPYAGAKLGAEKVVTSFCNTFNDLPCVVIRPFNNYGPRQHPEKLIPKLLTSLMLNKKLPIHGNGSAKRDWIHVHDTCRGIDAILHYDNFEQIKNTVINLGTGIALSVKDVAEKILKISGSPIDDNLDFIVDRPGQVDIHLAGLHKAKKILNWTPKISFDEGIAMTFEWYKSNMEYWTPLLKDSLIELELKDGNKITH